MNRPDTDQAATPDAGECKICAQLLALVQRKNDHIEELRKLLAFSKNRAEQWRDVCKMAIGQCFENTKNDMAALDRKLNKLFANPPKVCAESNDTPQ